MYLSCTKLVLSLLVLPSADCYCPSSGAKPGWKGTPVVEQISLTSVRVSWKGLVTRIDCADNFIVKYWPVMDPSDITLTNPVTTDAFEIDIYGIGSRRDYEYEMIAREDKGIFGVEYNKSGTTRFRTSSIESIVEHHVPTLAPTPQQILIRPSQHGDTNNDSLVSARPVVEDQLEVKTLGGMGVEVLVEVVMAGLIFLLIVVGILYNCVKRRRNMKNLEIESKEGSEVESDGDSLEFGGEEEENSPFTSDRESLNGALKHTV